MTNPTQQTLREYLQTRIRGTYEGREIKRDYIIDNFSILNLPPGVSKGKIITAIENYYLERGIRRAFGGSFDLNFEANGKMLYGISLSVHDQRRIALVTINNLEQVLVTLDSADKKGKNK